MKNPKNISINLTIYDLIRGQHDLNKFGNKDSGTTRYRVPGEKRYRKKGPGGLSWERYFELWRKFELGKFYKSNVYTEMLLWKMYSKKVDGVNVIDNSKENWSDPKKSYHLQREVIGINR